MDRNLIQEFLHAVGLRWNNELEKAAAAADEENKLLWQKAIAFAFI